MEIIGGIVIAILLCAVGFALISVFAAIATYGSFIKEEENPDLSGDDWKLNSYNENILMPWNHPTYRSMMYISKLPSVGMIIGKYQINGVGIIPWWNPLTKELDKKFEELKKRNYGV